MWVALARVVLATLVVVVVLVAVLYAVLGWKVWQRPVAAGRAWRERRRPLATQTRPVEEIALAARRLGCRHHFPPPGQRFAKADAVRQAYDGVLGEACDALGIAHLLVVLPPGADLDAERGRVEWALDCAGMELGLPL